LGVGAADSLKNLPAALDTRPVRQRMGANQDVYAHRFDRIVCDHGSAGENVTELVLKSGRDLASGVTAARDEDLVVLSQVERPVSDVEDAVCDPDRLRDDAVG